MRRPPLVSALLALTAVVAGLVAAPDRVAAAPAGDDAVVAVVVRGVGNGHGRGLSQWGSYGRAIAGQSWQQILAAYYGGTEAGTLAAPAFRVRLTKWDGQGAAGVISASGKAAWTSPSAGTSPATYQSIYAVEVAANVFDVFGSATGRGCPGGTAYTVPKVQLARGDTGQSVTQLQQLLTYLGHSTGGADGIFGSMTEAGLKSFQQRAGLAQDGVWQAPDWTAAEALLGSVSSVSWQQLGNDVAGPIRFSTSVSESSAASGDVLGLCEPDATITHYRGVIELTDTSGGNRVVNELDIENYLRGVVPRESPASWGDAAGGKGINALRAQAVAARSYALSQNRYSYASTCDTSSCQVYGGAGVRAGASSASSSRIEHANTDRAIVDTARAVRLWPGSGSAASRIVSTEFSASNGARTAGGAFAPVDDPYDDQPGNPYHRWTRIIDADTLMSTYGLSSADLVRTEVDPTSTFDGIWANRVRLSSSKTVSAWSFRNSFSLPAPGFVIEPITRSMTGAASFAFIGDSVGVSITDRADLDLRAITEGAFTAERYDALGSRRTQGGVVQPDGVGAARQVPKGTDLVVVELGYNDAPSAMDDRIDAVMTALGEREVGMVAWVTVSERRDGDSRYSSDYATTNAAIRAAADRWPSLVVLDWNAASDHRDADRWYADGVHLSTTGQAEFSLYLRDAVYDLISHGYTPPRPLAPSIPLRVPVTGVAGVPGAQELAAGDEAAAGPAARGVALNVTAVRTAGWGFVQVWPCGSPRPSTSAVNFSGSGAVEPNAVVVPVDETGEVCVASSVGSDVLVDVSGWFDAGLRAASGDLRLVDTRDGVGGSRLSSSSVLRVPVTGVAGVPVSGDPDGSAVGVALNVTAVRTAGWGFLQVWPCGSPRPSTSAVNFSGSGAVEPNAVVVPVDETGEVCVASSVGSDVLVDVSGWFDAGLRAASGDLRLVDTRSGIGPRPPR